MQRWLRGKRHAIKRPRGVPAQGSLLCFFRKVSSSGAYSVISPDWSLNITPVRDMTDLQQCQIKTDHRSKAPLLLRTSYDTEQVQ